MTIKAETRIGEGVAAAVRCSVCGCIAGFCNHPGCLESGQCHYGVVCRGCEPAMAHYRKQGKGRKAA